MLDLMHMVKPVLAAWRKIGAYQPLPLAELTAKLRAETGLSADAVQLAVRTLVTGGLASATPGIGYWLGSGAPGPKPDDLTEVIARWQRAPRVFLSSEKLRKYGITKTALRWLAHCGLVEMHPEWPGYRLREDLELAFWHQAQQNAAAAGLAFPPTSPVSSRESCPASAVSNFPRHSSCLPPSLQAATCN